MGDGHSKLETLAAAPAAGDLSGAGASADSGAADGKVELLVEKEVKVTSISAVLHSNGGDKVETTARVEETEVEQVFVPADGGQDEKDGGFAVEEEDDAAGGGDGDEDEGEEFFAGDFVWVKVKSYPWWPGQVFDSADASEAARRVRRKDRRLVACFGDGTFAWCYPFQMKSFEEDFAKFSRQSSSKSFAFAVEKALVEFGRCVEEEMVCPCLEPRPKLVKPYVLNAGIREGATVPDGRIKSHSLDDFAPADLVSEVRDFARGFGGVGDVLELAVLKSRLSAFYYAKGYGDLTEYYDPVVEGISDEEGDGLALEEEKEKVDVVGHGGGERRQVLERPDFADDKVHQRKKQRSMAELMAENVGHEAANHRQDSSSKSRKKKKVDLHVSLPSGGKGSTKSASPAGAKKPKKASRVPEEEQEDQKPSEDDESEDVDGREEEELILSSPRQRKKSKYLSPPYTMLGVRSVSTKKDVEGATEVDGATPKEVGDGKVDATSEASKDSDPQKKASACPTPRTPKGKRRGAAAGNTGVGEQHAQQQQDIAAGELLSDLNTAAANPTHKKAGDSSDSIKAFFQKFRSSSYKESSQMAACNVKQPGKPQDSDDEKLVPGAEQDGAPGPQKRKPKDEPSPRRKPKKADRSVDPPNGSTAGPNKEAPQEGKQAALLLTFSPGSTHPSKEELIKVFGEFGKLNEADTEVLEDAACARVVFLKAADGEKAFYGSDKISVLGHSVASYRLRYLSASSATAPAAAPTSRPSAGGAPLACIKKNLESMMTTLREPGCGEQLKSEVRSSLSEEIGGLLKKVSNLMDSATSSRQ